MAAMRITRLTAATAVAISLLIMFMAPAAAAAASGGGGGAGRRLGYPKKVTSAGAAGSGDGMKLGSNVLYCEGKCNGCTPCLPVAVVPGAPPSSSSSAVDGGAAAGYQIHEEGDTPYEPVVWKCECRPADGGIA